MHDLPDVPELSAGLSREQAVEFRASFAPEERERIERTVAELLDLLGKAHAMAVLRTFAFAEGSLRFHDLETRLEIPPNTLSARLSDLTGAGLLHIIKENGHEVTRGMNPTVTDSRPLFSTVVANHSGTISNDVSDTESL
jgi:DNA-binding HxlR family transcriptional regulator